MVRAQASKMILRIRGRSSLVYLGIEGAVVEITVGYNLKGPAGWSDSLLPNSRGRKESERVTKERFLQRWSLRSFLKLISSKNTLPNGLDNL